MAAVQSLCSKTAVFECGRVTQIGETTSAIRRYIEVTADRARVALSERKDRSGNQRLHFIAAEVRDEYGKPTNTVPIGRPCEFAFTYELKGPAASVNFGMGLRNAMGVRLSSLAGSLLGKQFSDLPPRGTIRFRVERLPYNRGVYSIVLDANSQGVALDRIEDAIQFSVEGGDFYGSGVLPRQENSVLVDFRVELTED
jgi:hypothetical protein